MAALLRSSKFLRLFSGFAKNFTVGPVRNEADNFLGNHKAFWQGIDTRSLSTHPAPVPVENNASQTLDKALQKLDREIRRTGRVTHRDVEEIYEEVKVTGAISSSQSLLLIRCCGNLVAEELPEQRTMLAQNIWQTLQSIGVPMDVSHYNALLRVYLENEHPFSPSEFLSYLKVQGVEPNRITYQRLIARYCLLGDIEGATNILEHMKENGLAINENVFNSLVIGHARANDLESAQSMISMMKRAHLEPSGETFRHLACAHAQRGDLDAVTGALELAQREDVQLHDRDLLEVIYTLTVAGHKQHVQQLLPRLQRQVGYNQEAMTVILRLVNVGQEDVAFSLLETMPRSETPSGEPISVGNFFVRQMVRAKRPVESVLLYCGRLRDQQLNRRAILVALHAALQQGWLDAAERLLAALPQHEFAVRQHYFWPLIIAAKNNGNLAELGRVLRLMQQHKCTASTETLSEQVLPGLQRLGSWDFVLYRLKEETEGRAAYSVLAPALCRHLLKTDQLRMAVDVADRYHVVLFHPANLVAPLASAYARSGDASSAARLLHHLVRAAQSEQLPETPRDVAASFLTGVVAQLNRSPQGTEGLEALLEAMVERGLAVSAETAARLQMELSELGRDRCASLLQQLSQETLQPAPLLRPDTPPSIDAGEGPARQERPQPSRPRDQLSGQIRRLEAQLRAARDAGQPAAGALRQLLAALTDWRPAPAGHGQPGDAAAAAAGPESIVADRARAVAKELAAEPGEALTEAERLRLFRLLVRLGELQPAQEAYRDLLENFPEARDDRHTLQLARLVLERAGMEEAVQLLQSEPRDVRGPQRRADERQYFLDCWRLVNVAAQRGDAAGCRRLLQLLCDEQLLQQPNRALLGLRVKAHLQRDDLTGALDEVEDIFKEHRLVPLRAVLMAHLINKNNTDGLQRLMDICMEAHGEMDTLYDLAFSFIDCGKMRQAKRVMDTPGLRALPGRLERMCRRYMDEGRLEELENLVAVTKDVFGVDRLQLYEHLLTALAKAEQPDRALQVWTQLEEEGLVPTPEMQTALARLLITHNRPVPFVVPEEALQQQQLAQQQLAAAQQQLMQQQMMQQQMAQQQLAQQQMVQQQMMQQQMAQQQMIQQQQVVQQHQHHVLPSGFEQFPGGPMGRRPGAGAAPQAVSAEPPPEPPANSIKSKLKRAIKAGAIDDALQHQKQMESEGVEVAIHDLSLLIELLVRADRTAEAVGITAQMLARSTFPQPRVFKFLMSRLSSDGNVDGISSIGHGLSDELKSATSYDNRLCTAYLNAGRGEEYLGLLEDTCRQMADKADASYVFPAGGFFGMLRSLPSLYPRCVTLAENFAASGVMLPANMLWVDHFVNQRYDEAQQLFDKYLHNQTIVLFRGVIDKATETENLDMTKRLYEMLKPTPISAGAKTVLLSSAINLSLAKEPIAATVALLRDSGFSADDLKPAVAERLKMEATANGLLLPTAQTADATAATAAPAAPAPAASKERPTADSLG